MKRVDGGYKLIEFFSAGWNSADAVVDVAAVEFRFGAVVLIKKYMLNTNFLISTTAPNLNSTAATSTTASALFHPAEKNSINL